MYGSYKYSILVLVLDFQRNHNICFAVYFISLFSQSNIQLK